MSTQVFTIDLPSPSLLDARVAPGDFLDCYAVDARVAPRRAAEIITAFPPWVRTLMMFRRVLTAPFGLSNDGPSAADKVGPFPVEIDTSDELIAGFDDKHLNFRVSVISRNGRVTLASWVHTHNIGGRAYLKAIMPFHILVAKNAMERVAIADGT